MIRVFIIGLIGMFLLVSAWIPQTLQSIKTRSVGANRIFLIVYVAASFFLTIYAISINDIIFSILNGLALLQASINLVISFMYQ